MDTASRPKEVKGANTVIMVHVTRLCTPSQNVFQLRRRKHVPGLLKSTRPTEKQGRRTRGNKREALDLYENPPRDPVSWRPTAHSHSALTNGMVLSNSLHRPLPSPSKLLTAAAILNTSDENQKAFTASAYAISVTLKLLTTDLRTLNRRSHLQRCGCDGREKSSYGGY